MANTTWNPADLVNITLSGGNLIAAGTTSSCGVRGKDALNSGKYYWEQTYTTIFTNSITTGIALATASLTAPTTGTALVARSTGGITVNNVSTGSSLGIIAPASVIGIAVDFSGLLIWFRVAPAGNWNGSGTANPATGVGGLSISSVSGMLYPFMFGGNTDKLTANFGDTAFSGAVPAGFTSGWPAGGSGGTTQARAMVLA